MRFDFLKKIDMKNKTVRITVLAIAVLLVSIIAGVSAKYIYDNRGKLSQVSALDFYFTVDLLGDTNELSELEKEIHLFGGGDKTATFNVQNYFDSLRVNEKDIEYTVNLESSDAGYDKASFTKKPDDFVMHASDAAHSDEYIVSFPTGYEKDSGESVTVTAKIKSSSPYVKEMKINFVLHPSEPPFMYRVEDNAGDNVARLIVMANVDVPAGDLNIDWSTINAAENALQIDTTSPHVLDGTLSLDSNDPGTGFLKSVTTTREITKGESIQIFFFKADPSLDYSIPDTNITPDTNGDYNVTIAK
ncbi:MAG: hypothetical protein IJ408_05535 [Clostridia bacterium]|nr:hypothetical protein [Clostridia bacterium]